jgi:6-phosphogluconolactonase
MTSADVVVHLDADVLAAAAAARLVTRVVDAQASRGQASIVLTGGGMGTRMLAAIGASPARDAVDWGNVDLWWGDERFVPAGDAERNDAGADEALLRLVPVNPDRVHRMPALGGACHDAEAAAAAYADELASYGAANPGSPRFDVLLLGVGPDGHVASLFPEQPALHEAEAAVVAVHGAPKPPPTRISMTFPTLANAHEVWFVVSGTEKAAAVRLALEGAGRTQIPAAGVTGLNRTLWLLDRDAASDLPADFARPQS